MAIPDGTMLQKIGEAILAAANDPWQTTTLSVTAASTLLGVEMVINRPDGSADRSKTPEDDALEWCEELRDEMYAEDEGTWYNASITVTQDGQIETTFDYDNPPFPGEDIPEDLLIDDNEAYPRAPDRLPDWHPSKTGIA